MELCFILFYRNSYLPKKICKIKPLPKYLPTYLGMSRNNFVRNNKLTYVGKQRLFEQEGVKVPQTNVHFWAMAQSLVLKLQFP